MASNKSRMSERMSPQYSSFHTHYSTLCDLLAGNQALILPFATHLYSNDIIAKGVHQSVQDSRNPPYERATSVLSAVETNMIVKPDTVFNNVLIGLKKIELTVALNGLIDTFESNGGMISSELRESLFPTASTPSLVRGISDPMSPGGGLTEGVPELRELMNTAALVIGKKWNNVAIYLGFDANEVDTIDVDNDGFTSDCIRDMFEQWESRGTPPYLWSTLGGAIISSGLKGKITDIERRREELKKYDDYYMEFAHIEPELCDLLELVGTEVSQKWHQIGIELKLNRSTLASIGHKRRSDDMNKIIEVFSEWSSQLSSPHNWQTILIALTVPSVNEKKLADNIVTQLKISMKK